MTAQNKAAAGIDGSSVLLLLSTESITANPLP
jgi:hypothetical protein